MATKVQAIPKGFYTITPYINIKGAVEAIEFYKRAFGAREVGRITLQDGSIAHAELEIGNSKLFLAEENEGWDNRSPQTLGGSAVSLCLYVEDVDAVFDRAIREGAKVTGDMEVKDQFYGDRAGSVIDPFGHKWSIMTHKEDVSFRDMQQKMNAMYTMNK